MTVGRMRGKLRAATSVLHERLHRHPGLAAAATGAIDLEGYRALLTRLYGFHRAFDETMRAYAGLADDAPRSRLLGSDLDALGVASVRQERLPLCETLPPVRNEAQAVGALYVVEGSALGGAAIARAVAPLLAPFNGAGCRFFTNDGGRRRSWPDLLERIEALGGEPRQEEAAIEASVATFEAFEDWMQDWTLAGGEQRGLREPELNYRG